MKHTMLSLNEILLALAVSAASNDVVAYAMSKLSLLKGCEAHCTHMVGQEDESLLLKLRVNLTCSPHFHQKICFINNRKRNERLYWIKADLYVRSALSDIYCFAASTI